MGVYAASGARRFVGVHFTCCDVYNRVYINRQQTAYEGHCPRCARAMRVLEAMVSGMASGQRMVRPTSVKLDYFGKLPSRGDFVRGAPRFVTVVIAAAAVALIVSAIFGWALAVAIARPIATLVLATSPGGIAEMCITAKALQLGVPFVTAAHVTRVVMVTGSAGLLLRWMVLARA